MFMKLVISHVLSFGFFIYQFKIRQKYRNIIVQLLQSKNQFFENEHDYS